VLHGVGQARGARDLVTIEALVDRKPRGDVACTVVVCHVIAVGEQRVPHRLDAGTEHRQLSQRGALVLDLHPGSRNAFDAPEGGGDLLGALEDRMAHGCFRGRCRLLRRRRSTPLKGNVAHNVLPCNV
jgi:hypothetical protein